MIDKILISTIDNFSSVRKKYLTERKYFVISINDPDSATLFGESPNVLNLTFEDFDENLSKEFSSFQEKRILSKTDAKRIINFVNQVDDDISSSEGLLLIISKEGKRRGAAVATWCQEYLGLEKKDLTICINEGEINPNLKIKKILQNYETIKD